MISLDEVLSRAQLAATSATKYKLGAGGMDPGAAHPSNIHGECDCSGYVCWCLGVSRKTNHPLYVKFNGGWINTDAIVQDAIHSTGFFRQLEKPIRGCLIVYPSQPPKPKIGHVGVVTSVNAGGTTVAGVLHCSSSNAKQNKTAICDTQPTVFKTPKTIYAWYEGIED